MKNTATFVITCVCGVIADIVSKWLVFTRLEEFENITLIPGLLNIARSVNEGVVFGLLPGKTNAFIIFSFIAIAVILYIYVSSDKFFSSSLALGLVLSGAAGNLWDRVWYKHVRDFIDLHLGEKYHWPTFNVADSLICIGVSFMVFSSFFDAKHKESS